ncbi:hypothetical protein [Planococcus halocryophilus]|uniref:hypothetical protein n=1 Tax=Planococcus halocryophilus TaxID=1215089 RepID=UPI001F0E59BC|nr:hypothetical protein [Planococcus halocryophilus]MCH4826770.1 hypothetical protein [Planococcus halocryophilus]
MTPPTTYSQWLDCLQSIKSETTDEEIMLSMELGSIEWTPGVAERFVQKIYETMEVRLKIASDQFQTGLNRSGNDETLLVTAILLMRKRLAYLMRLASLPALPEEVRDALKKILMEFADTAQKSLEESAKTDRTGQSKVTIRNNPITDFHKMERTYGNSMPKKIQTPLKVELESKEMGLSKRRRVIWK